MNKLLLSLLVVFCVFTTIYCQATLHLQGETTWYISSKFKKIDDNKHLFCIAASVSPKDSLQYTASLDIEVEDNYDNITPEEYSKKQLTVQFSDETSTSPISYALRTSVNVPLRTNDGDFVNGWKDDEFKAKGIIFGYINLPSKNAKPKLISFNLSDKVGKQGFTKIDGAIDTCKELLKVPATVLDLPKGDNDDNNGNNGGDDDNTNNHHENTTKILTRIAHFKWFVIGAAALFVAIIIAIIKRCIIRCRNRRNACKNYQEMQKVETVPAPVDTPTPSVPFSYYMAPQSANGITPMFVQPTTVTEGQQPIQVMFVPQQHFEQFTQQMNQQK